MTSRHDAPSLTPFQQAVLRAVRIIPPGTVASYGQIAAYVGAPLAARQVGWAMRSMEGIPDFPWWRVLNNAGRITIKGNYFTTAQLQKQMLAAEDVHVTADFTLNMAEYRFRASAQELADLKLDPGYTQNILEKYSID